MALLFNATDHHAVAYPTFCASKASFFTRAEEEVANTLVATDYKDPPVINDVQTASGTISASMGSKQWLGNQEEPFPHILYSAESEWGSFSHFLIWLSDFGLAEVPIILRWVYAISGCSTRTGGSHTSTQTNWSRYSKAKQQKRTEEKRMRIG